MHVYYLTPFDWHTWQMHVYYLTPLDWHTWQMHVHIYTWHERVYTACLSYKWQIHATIQLHSTYMTDTVNYFTSFDMIETRDHLTRFEIHDRWKGIVYYLTPFDIHDTRLSIMCRVMSYMPNEVKWTRVSVIKDCICMTDAVFIQLHLTHTTRISLLYGIYFI